MCHTKDTALWTIQMIVVSRELLDCTVFENVSLYDNLFFIQGG